VKAILIPVKEFHRSKERLARHYSEDERAALSAAMCEDFFAVVAQVHGVDRVYVVSKEYRALSLAKRLNWHIISEQEQISESRSVDDASHICAGEGVTALLRLPIDLPLANPLDIESIFAATERARCAILVPSRDGTGTNALLRSPPTLFRSRFGPNSFALHRAEAERADAQLLVIRNEHIAWDVDEPDDLVGLSSLAIGPALADWFSQYGKRK